MARPLEKTFDPKCYELAKAFVEDAIDLKSVTEEKKEITINNLAATIQEAVEDFLEYEAMKERGEVPDEPDV